MGSCSKRTWWRQGACAGRSTTPVSSCWTAHLSTKRERTRPMWRLRRRKTGKLKFHRGQCMSHFQSALRVIRLMCGLPVTSLLFILIHVACGVIWSSRCWTCASLQSCKPDKLLFTLSWLHTDSKQQVTSHRQQAHGNWLHWL